MRSPSHRVQALTLRRSVSTHGQPRRDDGAPPRLQPRLSPAGAGRIVARRYADDQSELVLRCGTADVERASAWPDPCRSQVARHRRQLAAKGPVRRAGAIFAAPYFQAFAMRIASAAAVMRYGPASAYCGEPWTPTPSAAGAPPISYIGDASTHARFAVRIRNGRSSSCWLDMVSRARTTLERRIVGQPDRYHQARTSLSFVTPASRFSPLAVTLWDDVYVTKEEVAKF
jgi:hypothetical protein